MMFSRRAGITLILTAVLLSLPSGIHRRTQATSIQLQTPEQFLGFRVGEDRKLARWDKIIEYLKLVDAAASLVKLRSTILSSRSKSVHRTRSRIWIATRSLNASSTFKAGRRRQPSATRFSVQARPWCW
jgi:hypothetical protein